MLTIQFVPIKYQNDRDIPRALQGSFLFAKGLLGMLHFKKGRFRLEMAPLDRPKQQWKTGAF